MAGIQFGVNVHGPSSVDEFTALVRRADELGYHVFAAPDHLGGLAPFAALTAAAAISPRLRLRTYVLNSGFWNPALLAREVATLDLLSNGRAELGIGAGHMKHEHDDARLPWPPLRERVAALEQIVGEVRSRLADPRQTPRPVQASVPFMVGAMSKLGLAVAARHADIVGLAGLRQIPGMPPGTFTLASAADTVDRVHDLRAAVGQRRLRTDLLLQMVVLGRAPEAAAQSIVAESPELDVDLLLDSPFVLLAETAEEAAAELDRRRQALDVVSVTTHQPYLEPLGEVIRIMA
jgi:probable F420-dependent oxidoreductase